MQEQVATHKLVKRSKLQLRKLLSSRLVLSLELQLTKNSSLEIEKSLSTRDFFFDPERIKKDYGLSMVDF